EAEQADQGAGWFKKTYPGCKATTYLVHPSKKLGASASLLYPIKVMRLKHLESLVKKTRAFFMEFQTRDLKDLSGAEIQSLIDKHGLDAASIFTAFGDEPVSTPGGSK